MSLTIRRATPADAATIVEFNRALAWESEAKALDIAVLTRGVEALIADAAKGFYTVAERNGEVIGQTLITVEWSDWRNGWFWWIQSVFVRTDARTSGVFRAIFEHLRREAIHEGVIGLRLYVERENERAKHAYHKLGMIDTSYELLELYPI